MSEKIRASLKDYTTLPESLQKIIIEFTEKHIELSDEQVQSIVSFMVNCFVSGYSIKENERRI